MSVADRAEDARILLNQSSYRLGWAYKYEPGKDPRVLCELAHDTIELALNSVIVAAGGKYRSTHDLGMLTKAAAAANEPLPKELDSVRQLPRYTGGGRYSFRRAGGQEPISRASYEHILNLAEKTNGWAKDRFRALTGEEIDSNGEAEKRKEELEPSGGRKPVVEGGYPAVHFGARPATDGGDEERNHERRPDEPDDGTPKR